MDEALPETRPAHDPHSPYSGLRGVSASLLKYLEARGIILTIEVQEAVQQVLRLVIFAILGGIVAFTGWLLAVTVVVSLLVEHMTWSWQMAAGTVAGGHLLLAVVLFGTLTARLSSFRWFADTLNEFRKDRAWLADQTHKH